MNEFPYARASTANFRLPRKRPIRPPLVESNTTIAAFLAPRTVGSQRATCKQESAVGRVAAASTLNVCEPEPARLAETRLQEHLISCRPRNQRAERTVKRRAAAQKLSSGDFRSCSSRFAAASLRCKSAAECAKQTTLSIVKRADARACKVSARRDEAARRRVAAAAAAAGNRANRRDCGRERTRASSRKRRAKRPLFSTRPIATIRIFDRQQRAAIFTKFL